MGKTWKVCVGVRALVWHERGWPSIRDVLSRAHNDFGRGMRPKHTHIPNRQTDNKIKFRLFYYHHSASLERVNYIYICHSPSTLLHPRIVLRVYIFFLRFGVVICVDSLIRLAAHSICTKEHAEMITSGNIWRWRESYARYIISHRASCTKTRHYAKVDVCVCVGMAIYIHGYFNS